MARNHYAGPCYRCGLTVEPGTGHFEKRGAGWRVQHGLVPGHGRMTCEMAMRAVAERLRPRFVREMTASPKGSPDVT